MRASFTQLYLHYVWATWDRLSLITPDIQKEVYGVIIRESEELKCTVIAIGGIEDHIHFLTGFSFACVAANSIQPNILRNPQLDK